MKEIDKLIKELNELSEDFPATKDRMVEIAKILLAEHFNYKPKEHGRNTDGNDS